MSKTLFIQDGPLAFFGTTANIHKPMQNLVNYLLDNHNLYLIGLERAVSSQNTQMRYLINGS